MKTIRCSIAPIQNFDMGADLLYTYNGESFSEKSLLYLQDTISSSYKRSIQKYLNLPFLKIYGKKKNITEKTFGEFHQDVENVRRHLLRSYGKFEVIITVDSNSYENLVFMTASILAGFTLAPMSPSEGAERVFGKQRQIGQKSVIFVGDAFQELFPKDIKILEIPLSEEGEQTSKVRAANVAPILIFTSGTTGYSKIVQQSEHGILTNVDALIELHGFEKRKVIATPLPIFHVNALEFSFFCSLLSGQRLIIYDGFDFATVLDSLEQDQVQILSIVPHVLKSLLDLAPKFISKAQKLEYCVTAASSLSPDLAKKLTETFPFKIIQGYGLSEAINFSLLNSPKASKESTDYWLTHFKRPSVGKPLRGNEVQILSDSGTPLGEGEEGEICIRGPGVMLGYKDFESSSIFAHGYLHTGDVGFYRICKDTSDRYFFITGRKKDIIKRYGLTISLVEIDDMLTKWLPPNLSAVAVPFENGAAGEEIGVGINSHATEEEILSLQNFLLEKIPSYMRPRVIARTDLKLRTDSGKPQRWALMEIFSDYKKTIFGEKIHIKK